MPCRPHHATASRSIATVSYADSDWHVQLADLLRQCCVIVFEPTGLNYSQPILTALSLHDLSPAIYRMNHAATGDLRRSAISSAKTDDMDSRALAYAASLIGEGTPPRGCRSFRPEIEQRAETLRHVVNAHRRLTKEQTRLLNQIDSVAHGIWPGMSKNTYIRAASFGAISPADMHELIAARPAGIHGNMLRAIAKMIANIPPIECANHARITMNRTIDRLIVLREEITSTDLEITTIIDQDPFADVTTRWRTVPSISDLDIAAFHIATRAEAATLDRDAFVSALAANPHTERSSTIDNTGKRRRKGYKPAMAALFMLTNRLLRPQAQYSIIQQYQAHLEATHRERTAPACRRKLASILSGIARNPAGAWKKLRVIASK